MSKFDNFQQFLATQGTQISLVEFLLNLLLAVGLATLLGRIYVRYGKTISNRKGFAAQFVLLTCTTMIVITIVKSSLALSLGLVGALSIVRFRAAIKEPEELVYLFLNIALGLGLGANQRGITILGFLVMAGFIVLRDRKKSEITGKNVILTISQKGSGRLPIDQAVQVLKSHFTFLDLKRLDENESGMEASFFVEYDGFDKINESKTQLQKLNPNLQLSFADLGGLI